MKTTNKVNPFVCCFCGSKAVADDGKARTANFFEGIRDRNGQGVSICSSCVILFFNQLRNREQCQTERTCDFCGKTAHQGIHLYRGPADTRICDFCLAADYLKRLDAQKENQDANFNSDILDREPVSNKLV
ncbi:MAG: ClpX C4-type zinc finger protein [Desulfobacterales bacterium]|nr:ClpX C4-type zinc finger protein [Desulfobacterales bacterium]